MHVWQPSLGPGASLRLRGPPEERQMCFDKPATASATSQVKISPLPGSPGDRLFLHPVSFSHTEGELSGNYSS